MLKPGDRIGDWVVVSALGEGGMGSVFRCKSALSERITAAVKVIKPHGLDATERFIREAEALYALRHPAVVRVTGFGEDAEKQLLWMAMELVGGEDLSKRLAKEPLPADVARNLFRLYAAGLAHAHERGIFHRDIKPANLTIDQDGTGVILDFGIAVSDGRTKLTQDGLIPGTLPYMPPEVFEGEMAEPQKTDIYSLGLVLYEALAGSEAFPEDPNSSGSHQMVRMMSLKLKSSRMELDSSVPVELRNAVSMATEPNPNKRLATMADFVRLLNREAPVDSTHLGTHWVEQAPQDGTHEVEDEPRTLPSRLASSPALPPQSRKRSKLGLILGSLAATGMLSVIGLVLLAVIVVALFWIAPWSSQSARFVQVCERGDLLNEVEAKTFEHLKKQEKQNDCAALWASLRERTTLSLKYGSGQPIDLGVFREMIALEELTLHEFILKDLSPLRDLSGLKRLEIHDSQVSDLDALSQVKLESLTIRGGKLRRVPRLSKVKKLDLSNNDLVSIDGLAALKTLEHLVISDNQISDLTPLKALSSLETLNADRNPIRAKTCPTSSTSPTSLRQFCNKLFPPKSSGSSSRRTSPSTGGEHRTTDESNSSGGASAESSEPMREGSNTSGSEEVAAQSLSKKEIDRAFKTYMPSINKCHSSYLKRVPNLAGDVNLTLTIERSGKVSRVSSAGSSVNSAEFAKCVENQVLKIIFPASRIQTHVKRKLTFKAVAPTFTPAEPEPQYVFNRPDCSRPENQSSTTVTGLVSYADYYMRQANSGRDVKRSCGIALANMAQAYCQDRSQLTTLKKIDAQCWKLGIR